MRAGDIKAGAITLAVPNSSATTALSATTAMKWANESSPWEPPTNLTAPGTLFNWQRQVSREHYRLYGMMMLYGSGFITKSKIRTELLTNISEV